MGGGAESPRIEGEKARAGGVESRERWRRDGRIREGEANREPWNGD